MASGAEFYGGISGHPAKAATAHGYEGMRRADDPRVMDPSCRDDAARDLELHFAPSGEQPPLPSSALPGDIERSLADVVVRGRHESGRGVYPSDGSGGGAGGGRGATGPFQTTATGAPASSAFGGSGDRFDALTRPGPGNAMRSKMLRGAALAAGLAAVAAAGAGITGTMSGAAGQYLVNTLIPIIEAEFSKITIPEISGEKDGFDYDVKNFVCQGVHINAGTVTLSPAKGIELSLAGVSVSCTGDWSFKLHIWPHIPDGSGSVDIGVSGASATLGLDVTASANGHPVLAPTAISINTGSISMSFHGSLWDWLLDLFKGLIESSVSKAIQTAFTNGVQTFITKDLNPQLANVSLVLPIKARAPYNISEVRFGLTSNPNFTDTYIGVGLQGDVVNIANPTTPPIPPPALPPFDPSAAAFYLQLHFSVYTALSAAYTFLSAGLMQWTIPSSSLPVGLNTTAAYALIAPGFPLAYPDSAVSLNVTVPGLPTIDLSPSGLNVSVLIDLGFLANANNGSVVTGFTLGAQTQLAGSLKIGLDSQGQLALQGQLTLLNEVLSVVNSNIGTVNVDLLAALINTVFTDIILPTINAIFANGVPLPAFHGITLVNPQLFFGTGFMTLASNFTFNASSIAAAAAEHGTFLASV